MEFRCAKCKVRIEIDEKKHREKKQIQITCPRCAEEFIIPIHREERNRFVENFDYQSNKQKNQNLQENRKEVNPKAEPTNPIQSVGNSALSKIDRSEKKNTNSKKGLVISFFFLTGILSGYFYYKNIYTPQKIDREAERYYTFANSSNIRSSGIAGNNFNVINTLPYGSEVIMYDHNNDWCFVKYNQTKGYIFSDLLLNKFDFFLLNSIFGDTESKECIGKIRYRLAILNYFKERHFIGRISISVLKDIYPEFVPDRQNQWEIVCRNKDNKPDNVFFSKIYDENSKFMDFAVIIKNITTSERKILIFTFLDDETPLLFYEGYAPYQRYIKDIFLKFDFKGQRQIEIQYSE
jgi:DNA-directed RNA polymerase subunit RPC12/RpoP